MIALALAVVTLNTPVLEPLYQTTGLLVFAYVVHFGSQALASTEQALRAVPDGLRESSRLLEPSRARRWRRVDLPLMRPGLFAGAGLVLLATVKELPATLLLSPIGFSTLATETWASYEDGFYAEAGVAAIVLIVLSGVLTWFLVLRRSALVTGRPVRSLLWRPPSVLSGGDEDALAGERADADVAVPDRDREGSVG